MKEAARFEKCERFCTLSGREVIRRDGKVLSVAGPQDIIFEADTEDSRNVIASNDLIYDPENYAPLK